MKTKILLAFVALGLLSCSTDLDVDQKTQKKNTPNVATGVISSTACSETYNLIAGQHHIAGTVEVTNYEEYITVEFKTTGDWKISQTHLHIGQSFPMNNGGNPQIGQFEYKDSFDPMVTSKVYTIGKNSIDYLDGCFNVAAHAVVSRVVNDEVLQSETAWAGDNDFPGKSWAKNFTFCVEDECEEDPEDPSCDTAFALGNTVLSSITQGNAWGWAENYTGGDGSFELELWAGAGQNNLDNGWQAGSVSVTVDGTNVTVEINLFDNVSMNEFQVYVSDNQPTTSAPGQYANFTTGTYPNYTYSGDGSFWLIVHAVTCTLQ